jgi:hypothetical protein
LKQDFQLGHGHAMAIVALLKGKQDLGPKKVPGASDSQEVNGRFRK